MDYQGLRSPLEDKMATHKSLNDLMKQDLNKVVPAAGFEPEEVKSILKCKPKQMYTMVVDAFADKKVQANLKKMVPDSVSVQGSGDDAMRIVITYANKNGLMSLSREKMLKDAIHKALTAIKGAKDGKKKCCGKCKKVGKGGKKNSR